MIRVVDYIYTPESGQYGIDLGYYPTTATTVKIKTRLSVDGNLCLGSVDSPSAGWFRFFTYENGMAYFDIPYDSNARIGIQTDTNSAHIYEFGISGDTLFIKDDLGHYADAYAGDYTFDFDTEFKLWGDKFINADSEVYWIEIYEDGVLVNRYDAAYDDVEGRAGLYDGTTMYYNNIDVYDINYQDLPAISVSPSIGRVNVEATGGSVSAVITTNYDFQSDGSYWEIYEVSSYQSAATISIDGQTGLHYYSGNTIGQYPFTITFPAWDGSGDTGANGMRNTSYAVEMKDSGGQMISIPITFLVRQKSPLATGTPLTIGDLQSETIYLGDDTVVAMYLGDNLFFGQ